MKLHARLTVLLAGVGNLGVVGMGLVGLSTGGHDVDLQTVFAPAPAEATHWEDPEEVTTTTWTTAPSFRPVVTATPPPPPLD